MSRDKQIEEMAEDIDRAIRSCTVWDIIVSGYIVSDTDDIARKLKEFGYRKASDVEDWKEIAKGYQKMFEDSYEEHQSELREIFEEIEKMLLDNHIGHYKTTIGTWSYNFNNEILAELTELKKKYTEGER